MRGKPSKDQHIDLGLAILAAVAEPPHTTETIAAFCGCTRQRISQIELKALRKLRCYMEKGLSRELRDVLKSKLSKVAITFLAFVSLAIPARADQDGDTFIGVMKRYGELPQCTVFDCQCWTVKAQQRQAVSYYAQEYLSNTHDKGTPLASTARAWIDLASIETAFWNQWGCRDESELSTRQLEAKENQAWTMIQAQQRLLRELDALRQWQAGQAYVVF
jgi:hypothetical protein